MTGRRDQILGPRRNRSRRNARGPETSGLWNRTVHQLQGQESPRVFRNVWRLHGTLRQQTQGATCGKVVSSTSRADFERELPRQARTESARNSFTAGGATSDRHAETLDAGPSFQTAGAASTKTCITSISTIQGSCCTEKCNAAKPPSGKSCMAEGIVERSSIRRVRLISELPGAEPVACGCRTHDNIT